MSQTSCLHCNQSLFLQDIAEEAKVVLCPKCHFKYEFIPRTVESQRSQLVKKDNSLSLMEYHLRLRHPSGHSESKTIQVNPKKPIFEFAPGDPIILINNALTGELLSIINEQTKSSLNLRDPSTSAIVKGVISAAIPLCLCIFIFNNGGLATRRISWIAGIIGSSAIGILVSRKSLSKERDETIIKKLAYEQYIFSRQHDINLNLLEITNDEQEDQTLVSKLKQLKEKMQKQTDIYSDRIKVCDKAIHVLDQKIDLYHQLKDSYNQILNMIDIECMTAQLVDQLPGDIDTQILRQTQELETINQQIQSLAIQVDPQKLLGGFP